MRSFLLYLIGYVTSELNTCAVWNLNWVDRKKIQYIPLNIHHVSTLGHFIMFSSEIRRLLSTDFKLLST